MTKTHDGGSQPGRGLSRRQFLATGSAALAGAAIVAACGGGNGGGGGGGGGGTGKVVFTHGPDDSGILKKQIDRFNTENHGFQVDWRTAAADTGQYFDSLRTQFQAGSSEIDVMSGDVIWPAQFAANGWVEDLSSRFNKDLKKDDFLPGPTEAVNWNGKTWGVPWYTDFALLWYRADLLDKAGVSKPPTTYEELIAAAKQVVQKTGTKYGYIFQGAAYEGGVCNALEYIWNSGGGVLDPKDSKKVVIDSTQAIAGMTAERNMVTAGVTPDAVSTFKEQDSHTAFLNGEAVFLRNWPYVYGLIGKLGNLTTSQVGVVPLPVSQTAARHYTCLGGWNLFMNAASKNKDQAWELIKYLAAPAQVKERAIGGSYLSPLKALYDDAEILQKVPVYKLAKDVAPGVRARPVSPVYSDISLKMQASFNNNLKGTAPTAEIAKTLQTDLQSIVSKSK